MNLIFAIIDPKKSMMFFWPKKPDRNSNNFGAQTCTEVGT